MKLTIRTVDNPAGPPMESWGIFAGRVRLYGPDTLFRCLAVRPAIELELAGT